MTRSVQDRKWWVDGDPLVVDDEEEISQALGDVVRILTRIGGGFNIAAQREEVAPGYWQTTSYVFQWVSFVPGKRAENDPQPDLTPVPDPEPISA